MKDTGGGQCRVSAPGVTETAGTALCGRQFRNFTPSGSHVGLKNKLGHALSVLNTSLVTRGVQKEHQNFTGIVRVDDANALSNGNAVARAKAAARVYKTGNASGAGLHAYARAYLKSAPGGDDSLWPFKAGAQIHACRMAGGRGQKIILPLGVELTRTCAYKGNVHGGHACVVRYACCLRRAGGVLCGKIIVHQLLVAQVFGGGKRGVGTLAR